MIRRAVIASKSPLKTMYETICKPDGSPIHNDVLYTEQSTFKYNLVGLQYHRLQQLVRQMSGGLLQQIYQLRRRSSGKSES